VTRIVIHTGCDTRQALAAARRLGCSVTVRPGTGDYVIRHPTIARSMRVSVSRKDAPRSLTVFLSRLEDSR